MLSKSLKNLNYLRKNGRGEKNINKTLKNIYNKNICLVSLKKLKDVQNKNKISNLLQYVYYIDEGKYGAEINNEETKIIFDALVYFYRKYNFFIFNDIESILYLLSACGSVDEFKIFYEIFRETETIDFELLVRIVFFFYNVR